MEVKCLKCGGKINIKFGHYPVSLRCPKCDGVEVEFETEAIRKCARCGKEETFKSGTIKCKCGSVIWTVLKGESKVPESGPSEGQDQEKKVRRGRRRVT